MTIILKNKQTLQIGDFLFRCCIGKKGLSFKKKEGDNKTPKGVFRLENLYYRKDRVKKPQTALNCVKINNDMGWCNDINYPKKYNKLFKIDKKINHEKLKRIDCKYDLLIPIKYNFHKPVPGMGSCIFIHLTKNYNPTAGCIGIKKKDFLVMLKLIKKNTIIKIN